MKCLVRLAAMGVIVAAALGNRDRLFAQNVSVDPSGRYYRNSAGQPMFLIGYYAWAPMATGATTGNGGAQYLTMITNQAPYKINYIRVKCHAYNNPGSGLPGDSPFGVVNGQTVLANQVALPNTVNWDPVYWSGLADVCSTAQNNGVIVNIGLFDGVSLRSGDNAYAPGNQDKAYYPAGNYGDCSGCFYRLNDFNNNTGIGYYQRAVIDKVIATTAGFNNVMYEIGNELGGSDSAWNTAVVSYVEAHSNRPIAQTGGVLATNLMGRSEHQPPENVPQVKSTVASLVGSGYPAWVDPDNDVWPDTFGLMTCGGNCSAAYAAADTGDRQSAWYSFVGGAACWGGFTEDYWDWPNPHRGFSTTLGNYYKNLQDFISNTGVPFWNMVPHNELVSNGNSSNSCLAKVGNDYVVYVISDTSVTVDLTTMTGSASWRTYDPVAATYSSFQTVNGGTVQNFNKPSGASDWVLQITNGGGEVLTWNTLGNQVDLGVGTVSAVAADAQGNVHVIFVNGNTVQYRKYSSAFTLLTSESISAPSGAYYPHIMCDSNSVPHVVYTEATLDYANFCYYTNRIGGSWKTPVVAFNSGGTSNVWYPRLGLWNGYAYIGSQFANANGLAGRIDRLTNLSTTPTVNASVVTAMRSGIAVNSLGQVFAIGRNGGAGTYAQQYDSNLNTVGGLQKIDNGTAGKSGGSQTGYADNNNVVHFVAWAVETHECNDRCGMTYNNTGRRNGDGSYPNCIQGLLGGPEGTGPDGNEVGGWWNDDVAPVIAADPLGTVYVAWREWTAGGVGRVTKVDNSAFTQTCTPVPACGTDSCTGTQFSGTITRRRWWNCEIAPAPTRGVYAVWDDASGHCFLRSVGVAVASSNQSKVTIDMGTTDAINGLTNVQVGDGNTAPITIGSRDCRKNVTPSTDRYMYFSVTDSYAFQGNHPDQYMNVDYYDTGTSTLTLNYDGTASAYVTGPSVTLTNTNTWKTVTWHITDAYFGNRENSAADFRIFNSATTNFYLDKVSVYQKAFSGTPMLLPGTIQAENFDNGGEGQAYHDTDTPNNGGQYRTGEAVDIENTSDTGGGFDVGFIANTEYLNYQVNVTTAGKYNIGVRAATPNAGVTFHIEMNGSNVTGTQSVPNTGGYQTWTTVTIPNVTLSAGVQTLKVSMDNGGWNFNYVSVASVAYTGTPVAIPGTVQAENYDNGGEGYAYHDTTTINEGGQYRTSEGVDIETTGDTGGGFDVGFIANGEWINYQVNVTTAGVYDFTVRAATPNTGVTFHLEINAVNVSGTQSVPNTGGWGTWTDKTISNISLSAGVQTLKVFMDNGSWNFNNIIITLHQGPYGGTNWAIPGTIQAENYDIGGEGIAFHDMTTTNDGGQYRTTEAVDIETCTDTGGGYDVGWMDSAEWLEYTVNVNTTGDYAIKMRLAAGGSGGTFHLTLDGATLTSTKSVSGTGGWQTWTTIIIPGIYMSSGNNKILRFTVDTGGYNVNYMDFTYGGADVVSEDLGATNIDDGMTHPQVAGDGDTAAASIGGHNCRVNVNNSVDFYFYFTVSDSYAFQGNKNVADITVDYYDNGTGTLSLQYDGTGGAYINGPSVTRTNTNTWKSNTYHVTDAYFGNRENGGADFRIAAPVSNTFYLDTVMVFSSTGGSPPGQATSPNPANGATLVAITSSLSWTAGSGATSHDVRFGTANPPPFIQNQAGTSYTPATMSPNTVYYWRIDEKNSFGTTTGTVWSFTTLPLPGAASSPSPANGATLVAITTALTWTAGSNAASHDVRFGTANPPPFIQNQAGTSYNPTKSPNTLYYWRIDEKNTSGTTTGTVWSFTTLPLPGAASSPSPANGATLVAITTALTWTAGSNAASHDVRFGTANPPPFIQNQAGTSYNPTKSPNTLYYWRIDEVNSSGTTTGTVWSFTTLPLPGVASAPNPASGATGVSTSPTLTWTAGSNATSHDVRFGTANPPPFIQNQAGTSYAPGSLSGSTLYYWRIDEKNSSGTTTGTVWSFTTAASVPTYFVNSSFEGGFGAAGGGYNGSKGNNWTPYVYTGVAGDLTFADETGAGNIDSGFHSQKITAGAGKEGGVYNQFSVVNGNTYTVTVRAKSASPTGQLWFGINTSGGTDPHEASGTIYPAQNSRSTNWTTFTWTGTATGSLITLFLDTYDGAGYWDTATPGPVTLNNSAFPSDADGWNIVVWRAGPYSDGVMTWYSTTGNPSGNMFSYGSGATSNNDSCNREGGEINKVVSTSGYNTLVQVVYDVRFVSDQTGTDCIGGCLNNVMEGDCADKLAVYYSTAGTGGPWTLLEQVYASALTQSVWYTRTINCPAAANNKANFAVRFRFQFNTSNDTARLDNIKVIATP